VVSIMVMELNSAFGVWEAWLGLDGSGIGWCIFAV
jgi:hypothetical protein